MITMTKDDKYLCLYCQRRYEDKEKATECYTNHDIIYLPISSKDLNAIFNFLYLREEKLLEETGDAIRIIRRYLKERVRKKV